MECCVGKLKSCEHEGKRSIPTSSTARLIISCEVIWGVVIIANFGTIKIIYLICDFDVKGSYVMLPNNNHEKKSRNDG